MDANSVCYTLRDIRLENPTEAELRQWHAANKLPVNRFFHTSGLQYKALGLSLKLAAMRKDVQFALLTTDGMLVKRPILVGKNLVLVGFRQSEWEEQRKRML